MPDVLRTKSLRKSYNNRVVVDDVSIEIGKGEVVGLLGPNGAGKTTTFYLVLGLVAPESGKVFLNEEEITHYPIYLRARKGISYLPQEPSIFRKLTVKENLVAILETLALSPKEREEKLKSLLEEFGIAHLANSKAYTLSGGERRRVEIARALVISPSFILLDEPFAGIDPIAVQEIQKTISHLSRKGIGILITDHNVRETLKITDKAYIIKSGVIFRKGSPLELSNDEEVRKIYFGESFRLE